MEAFGFVSLGLLIALAALPSSAPTSVALSARLPRDLEPFFTLPPEFAGQFGAYRSPLRFDDGTPVQTAADWPRRRREILHDWQALMGQWPAVIERPKMDTLSEERRENFTQKRVRLEIAPGQFEEGWLLIPDSAKPRPAVLVVFYEPETGVGLNPKQPFCDYGLQLARRGFVTLNIGTPGGDARKPYVGATVCQPLSFHAYVAANCWQALAHLPDVDSKRIGIVGHSYGGKWALFAGALWEKFAAVAVSDPGIVFDETRPNVNYWEPWYLGLDPVEKRPKAGVPSTDNPRTGAYKRMIEQGRDLHELHALLAPRPFFVSGGSEDPPARWLVLNHLVEVNRLLGFTQRVGMTNRPEHSPDTEANAALYAFFTHFLNADAGAGKPMPPITLHPQNPHYFVFRGKPTVLITSGEHYGAVLNSDFDYVTYLETLHKAGLNYTRIFTGAYCEDAQSFNIRHNTLAPQTGRLLCPWKRSDTPGYVGGGNKFDLSAWDDAYFQRLKQFCAEAGKRGIVVEISLFCPFYEDSMWHLSPMNAENNVNGIGKSQCEEVYTLQHPDLTAAQEAMVRKIVEELKDYDNLFYEICNEPYFGGVTLEWQRHIAAVIADTEKPFPHRHLIAQNIANGTQKVEHLDPNVSIFNFHYAAPPNAFQDNAALNRVVGCDETGFKGIDDVIYRTEGWDFILAGGALYNNLDYSFTVAHPDGTHQVEQGQPGGGSPALRAQLKVLKDFLESFDFIRMQPDHATVKSGAIESVTVRALSEPGKAYAFYVKGGKGKVTLQLALPAGDYRAEWIHPRAGQREKPETVTSSGKDISLVSPAYEEDIALRLVRL